MTYPRPEASWAEDPDGWAEVIVADVCRHEHGANFDRLVRDPANGWGWIVVLKDGRTSTVQIGCMRGRP